MPAEVTYPVQVLREHAVALEAALTVCLADPGQRSVHRLRTETRRVEAQLLLLPKVPGIPDHRKAAERLRQALRRLRQAAGEVRDLDVHRKRLDELANEADKQELTETPPPDVDAVQQAVREGATELRDHLKSKRDRAAEELRKLLEGHQSKAARATEKLLKALEESETLPLAARVLLQQAEGVFLHPGLLGKAAPAELSEDELHTVRKAAKAARYLAETLPGDAATDAAAARFEALQEAGGQWHDALELARAAKRHLGRRHELTLAMAAERDRNLLRYREALAREADVPSPELSAASQASKATAGPEQNGARAKPADVPKVRAAEPARPKRAGAGVKRPAARA